jgi:uncharacterized protein (DUF1697 family)
MASAGVHVALFRGINVGGKNKLPMRDLSAFFADAGATDVRTYIQSGNVVFRASNTVLKRLSSAVADRIEERFGHRPPIVLRSAAELCSVLDRNPFLERGADPKALHVAFLDLLPSDERIASLDPERSPGDAFAVRGREIYLYLPNGAGRSKLTNAYFDSRLKAISTARNWRTVQELAAMASAGE